ncbi:MAG: hypothetical protein WC222_02010 [Parachlamydiales bacterium]
MRRWFAIIFCSVLIAICTVAAVYTCTSLWKHDLSSYHVAGEMEEEQALRVIAGSLAFFSTDQSKAIWPEYNLNQHPIVVTFDNTHIYAFNLNSHNPVWENINVLGTPVQFTAEDVWGTTRIQSEFDYNIDGISSFVFHLDLVKDDILAPFIKLIHEHFRNYQKETFITHQATPVEYLDHFNFENIILMQIEDMILADFMNGQLDPEKSAFHKAAALRDFLAVNTLRRKLLFPSSIEWELFQQRTGGMADYVAVKSIDQFPFVKGFSGTQYLLTLLQASTVNEEVLERMVKWRHYGVGAALGYALDSLEVPYWKERVVHEENPMDILREQILLDDNEITERMEKIKKRYGYDNVKHQVAIALKQYQDEVADLAEEFDELKGVEINFSKPGSETTEGVGSALYVYYMSDGSTLSLADTSKVNTLDKSWSVQLEGTPMVIKKNDGTLKLKVEPETEFTLDGKKLTAIEISSQNFVQPFQKLQIAGYHCNFNSHLQKGQIESKEGKIFVKYNP